MIHDNGNESARVLKSMILALAFGVDEAKETIAFLTPAELDELRAMGKRITDAVSHETLGRLGRSWAETPSEI